MLKAGVLLVLVGASAYVLPMMNMKNRLVALFPLNLQPYVGGGIIGVGVILCVLGLKKGKKKGDKK